MTRNSIKQQSVNPRPSPAIYAALAACLIVTVLWGAWYWVFRSQEKALAAELSALEAEWANVSVQLAEAKRVNALLDGTLARLKQVAAEHDAQGWARALERIVATAGAEIELRGIHAVSSATDPDTCALLLEGIAAGAIPRVLADRFRVALEGDLKRNFPGEGVTTRFERLDDAPKSAASPANEAVASFAISATIPLAKSLTASKEGI